MDKLKAALGAVCDVWLTPAGLADAFCEMTCEEQAQFFIWMSTIMANWNGPGQSRSLHLMRIGDHLKGDHPDCWFALETLQAILDAAKEP